MAGDPRVHTNECIEQEGCAASCMSQDENLTNVLRHIEADCEDDLCALGDDDRCYYSAWRIAAALLHVGKMLNVAIASADALRRERDAAIAEASEYKLAYETCHKNACGAIAALEKMIGIVDANARFFGLTKSAYAELNEARQIIERSKR